MADDNMPKRVSGVVLPAVQSSANLPIDPPLQGIPLFNRMRYRSIRKELDEYLSVLEKKEAIIRRLDGIARASEDFSRTLIRTERWDDLRVIEHNRIDAELDQAFSARLAAAREAHISDLAHRARLANVEAEAIEAEQRLNSLKGQKTGERQQTRSPDERIKSKVADIRAREAALIAAITGDTPEAQWPEEVRELVADVRLAARNHMANLVDEFR
jgi:hypothetical protein